MLWFFHSETSHLNFITIQALVKLVDRVVKGENCSLDGEEYSQPNIDELGKLKNKDNSIGKGQQRCRNIVQQQGPLNFLDFATCGGILSDAVMSAAVQGNTLLAGTLQNGLQIVCH